MPTHIVSRKVVLGDQHDCLARVNFRGIIETERVSGKSYTEVINAFLSPRRAEATACLLWGLTATYRFRKNSSYPVTEADRRSGFLVPETFLDTIPLPPSAEYHANKLALSEMFDEAGLVEYVPAPQEALNPP